ncbi:MAG: aspartate aminotransferase family protein [Candidatus Methanomethylicus sp.]|nr:aspartate aminotransferase family protein [Candidatus Methanomethylicus sp.]
MSGQPPQDETVELVAKYTYGTWRFQKGWKKPPHIVDAEGVYFTDASGKKFLDFSSQLMCSNLGHKNQALIDAIVEQAKKMPYIGPAYSIDIRAQVSKALVEVMPKGLEKYFYSTSGTEANEAAFKIVRMYQKPKGAYKIISRYTSYHGATAGSIAATGDPRRWFSEPTSKIPGVIFAPDCNCYRCPFRQEYPSCGITCAEYVDYMIKNEANVAAMIVEPVVGTNGVLVPVKEYLPRLKQICEENDVIFIADEVMAGWGRTGKWFAVDNWDVKPDIITTAKGSTGAYTPLGITATTRKIADYFEDNYFAHGHTYEAHPLAMSPVVAAINEYKRMHLLENAKELGKHMSKRLNELKERHISIGDVRGIGLFWAIEIVKDRKTKKPFNTRVDKATGAPLMVDKVAAELSKRGIIQSTWISHFVIAPPLIITKEQLDFGIDAFDEALRVADAEVER